MRGGSRHAAIVAAVVVPLALGVVAMNGCHTKTDICLTGCQPDFVLWPYWCLCSGECAFEGVAVAATACCPVEYACIPDLQPHETLRIPIPWQELWGANRLLVDLPGVDVSQMTLLFDGVAATGCTVEPGRFDCPGMTPDVQTLEISYDGVLTGHGVWVFMLDPACHDYSRCL